MRLAARALKDNYLKLLIFGSAAGVVHHQYIIYRHRKNFKSVIEILKLQDEMIHETHGRLLSVADFFASYIDGVAQKEYDEQFINIVNKNYE